MSRSLATQEAGNALVELDTAVDGATDLELDDAHPVVVPRCEAFVIMGFDVTVVTVPRLALEVVCSRSSASLGLQGLDRLGERRNLIV